MHIVEFLKRQRHAYDTRRIILILHLNFCLSHPRITKGISENSLDVHIESIFRMSWSLLLLVPSPCRICHLLIRGDMCGFSFPLFSPLAAALGFSLALRRLGKRKTRRTFFENIAFFVFFQYPATQILMGTLKKVLELEIDGPRN